MFMIRYCHSKFICTESPDCTFFCRLIDFKVPDVNMSEYHKLQDYTFCNVNSHYDKSEKCVLCRRIPPTVKSLSAVEVCHSSL
jgi:hypothetical protein